MAAIARVHRKPHHLPRLTWKGEVNPPVLVSPLLASPPVN
jgi:hypothetical protein